jgi:hypothetical protein
MAYPQTWKPSALSVDPIRLLTRRNARSALCASEPAKPASQAHVEPEAGSEQVPTYCQPAGQGITHHPKLVPKLVPKRAFLTLSQRSWRQYLRAHRPHMTPQEATFNPAGRVRVPHGAFSESRALLVQTRRELGL